MKLQLLSTLLTMHEIYSLPKGRERFQRYIQTLQGEEGTDMIFPIGGFNPMANEDVKQKIEELIDIKIEDKIRQCLSSFSFDFISTTNEIIQLALNITDDIGGAWSEKYTTDFDNKFSNQALLKRNFCVITVFTSENLVEELIMERLLTSVYRCDYQLEKGFPKTLEEYVLQEKYVHDKCQPKYETISLNRSAEFYESHKNSISFNHIFFYLYGEEICKKLNFPVFKL